MVQEMDIFFNAELTGLTDKLERRKVKKERNHSSWDLDLCHGVIPFAEMEDAGRRTCYEIELMMPITQPKELPHRMLDIKY